MSHLIYTYGTLKRGFHNHILLATSTFVQEAKTEPRYRLYDCGSYPCLIKVSKDGRAIHGEIYKVDDATLRRLDRLEGVPFLYQRGEIALQDFPQRVLAYFYQDDISDFADCGDSWPRKGK